MSDKFPQILHPEMAERTAAWGGDYEVVWSIYIQCNNRDKLRRVHIPALENLIGRPHGGRGWSIEREDGNSNEMRLMTAGPLTGPYSETMLLSLLKKLYALKPDWRIMARLDEEHPRGVYVCARYAQAQPDGTAPAVSDVMVELQPNFSDR